MVQCWNKKNKFNECQLLHKAKCTLYKRLFFTLFSYPVRCVYFFYSSPTFIVKCSGPLNPEAWECLHHTEQKGLRPSALLCLPSFLHPDDVPGKHTGSRAHCPGADAVSGRMEPENSHFSHVPEWQWCCQPRTTLWEPLGEAHHINPVSVAVGSDMGIGTWYGLRCRREVGVGRFFLRDKRVNKRGNSLSCVWHCGRCGAWGRGHLHVTSLPVLKGKMNEKPTIFSCL